MIRQNITMDEATQELLRLIPGPMSANIRKSVALWSQLQDPWIKTLALEEDVELSELVIIALRRMQASEDEAS